VNYKASIKVDISLALSLFIQEFEPRCTGNPYIATLIKTRERIDEAQV
jgi:hypothetical protein